MELNDLSSKYMVCAVIDDGRNLRYKIDLVIKNLETNSLLLLEFRKSEKYFCTKEVIEYCDYKCLIVTEDENSKSDEVNVVKFLSRLQEYLP